MVITLLGFTRPDPLEYHREKRHINNSDSVFVPFSSIKIVNFHLTSARHVAK